MEALPLFLIMMFGTFAIMLTVRRARKTKVPYTTGAIIKPMSKEELRNAEVLRRRRSVPVDPKYNKRPSHDGSVLDLAAYPTVTYVDSPRCEPSVTHDFRDCGDSSQSNND